MENISRIKEKCVGCKSCEQSCPKHCISMVENKEGFWYPSVDEKSCIECKVCLKKCPVENTEFHRNEPHKVWAWRNKNNVDIIHIMHMFDFLKNGGTLISLTYPLWIMNNGENQTKFRKWLENKNYTMKMLIDNSFVENYKTQPSIKLIIKK